MIIGDNNAGSPAREDQVITQYLSKDLLAGLLGGDCKGTVEFVSGHFGLIKDVRGEWPRCRAILLVLGSGRGSCGGFASLTCCGQHPQLT